MWQSAREAREAVRAVGVDVHGAAAVGDQDPAVGQEREVVAGLQARRHQRVDDEVGRNVLRARGRGDGQTGSRGEESSSKHDGKDLYR